MPIDFAAIAARYVDLAVQDRLANTACRIIDAALHKRLIAVRAAEVGSRDLPTLRFEDGALAVRVLTATAESAPAVPGLAGLTPPEGEFAAGWHRWLHAGTDLPALLDAADALLAAVEESIGRYAAPTPQAFDPRGRTVFDLFGVAAAMFTTMKRATVPGGDLDRLRAAVVVSATLMRGGRSTAAASGVDAQPSAGGAAPPPQAGDGMDALGLAAATMLIALPRLVSLLLEAVELRAQLLSLDVLQKVERAVRADVAATYQRVFNELQSIGYALLQLVRGIQAVVGAYARGTAAFVLAFGTGFAGSVRDFIYQLAGFLQVVIGFAQVVVAVLEAVGLDRWVPSNIWLPDWIPDEAAPLVFHSNLPDFGKTLFGEQVRRRVGEIISATDEGMRSVLETGFGRTADGLDAAAGQFSRLADAVADAGPLAPGLGADADRLTAGLFATEPAPAQRDPLAQAFDSWIAHGGIAVLAAMLDGYAQQMARLWRARYIEEPTTGGPTPEGSAPTSPHILRRHGAPGRVEVPRVLIRVGGPAGDDVLDTIAAEFAGAVAGAYRQGAQQLRDREGAGTWTK